MLLLFAVVAALLPLASTRRLLVSLPRLVVESFTVTLAVVTAVWLGWLALWVIEHR